MNYKKYQKSRDSAWQILIDCHIDKLPVRVSEICKNLQIKIVNFSAAQEFIKTYRLEKRAEGSDGFTFNGIIFYNDKCNPKRQRFTVAHELGHLLLHNGFGFYNREPSRTDNPLEMEANVFASRLLAPACVLWGIGAENAKQIAMLCDISLKSAKFRYKRLKKLYRREEDFYKKYGKSCFLQSPLERKVYEQFGKFISQNKL